MIARERSRVAEEGWGRLLDLQGIALGGCVLIASACGRKGEGPATVLLQRVPHFVRPRAERRDVGFGQGRVAVQDQI